MSTMKHTYSNNPARRVARHLLSGLGTRGFTLVELIVAMSVSLIVIGITTALLLSGTNMAQHTAQRALEEQIIDGTFNYAEKQLRFAASVEKKEASALGSIALEDGERLLYVSTGNGTASSERGFLFSRQEDDVAFNVLGEQFYSGHTVSLEAELIERIDEKPVVSIKIILYDAAGSKITERERSITLINGANGTSTSTTPINSPALLHYALL